jgi:hypothetical protein
LLRPYSNLINVFAQIAVAGTSLAPQLIGYLQEKPGIKGTTLMYTVPIILFVVCAATALVLSLVLIAGMGII